MIFLFWEIFSTFAENLSDELSGLNRQYFSLYEGFIAFNSFSYRGIFLFQKSNVLFYPYVFGYGFCAPYPLSGSVLYTFQRRFLRRNAMALYSFYQWFYQYRCFFVIYSCQGKTKKIKNHENFLICKRKTCNFAACLFYIRW